MADPTDPSASWHPDPDEPKLPIDEQIARLLESIRELVKLADTNIPQAEEEGAALESLLIRLFQFLNPQTGPGADPELDPEHLNQAIADLQARIAGLLHEKPPPPATPDIPRPGDSIETPPKAESPLPAPGDGTHKPAPPEGVPFADEPAPFPSPTPDVGDKAPGPSPIVPPELPIDPDVINPSRPVEDTETEKPTNIIEELLKEILEVTKEIAREVGKHNKTAEKKESQLENSLGKSLMDIINSPEGPGTGMGGMAKTGQTISDTFKKGSELAALIPAVGETAAAFLSATGAVFAFGAGIITTLDALRSWGNNLHQANMQFSEFSASMAGVRAATEAQEIVLSRQRGERRAPAAREAARVHMELERQLFAPMEDSFASFKNEIYARLGRGQLVLLQLARNTEVIGDILRALIPEYNADPMSSTTDQGMRNIEQAYRATAPQRFQRNINAPNYPVRYGPGQ